MIHAFLAGFAGCIGVLVACVCWNRCNEWLAGREERRLYPSPPSPSRQRAVAWGWAGGIAALFLAMFTSILTH